MDIEYNAVYYNQMMQLAFYYLTWHYGRSLRDYLRTWTNFIWFFWHYFSISNLATTFFSPFHRIQEKKRSAGIHPEEFFANLVTNTLMRIVGMIMRFILMVIGLLTIAGVLVSGGILFFAWLALPLTLALTVVTGVIFIFM